MKIFLFLMLCITLLTAHKKSIDDEELRLMYDSFLYTKDLKNAYKIAKKAVKIYPNNLAWHQKLADIALWSGDNTESMNQSIYLYQHNDDPKLAKKIITHMLASYQYKKALPLITNEFNKNEHAVKELINIYDKVGKPEEAIKRLKKAFITNPSADTLSTILSLQIELGDITGAKESVDGRGGREIEKTR